MVCTQGAQARLIVDAALPFDDNSEAYDFLYETMQAKKRIVGTRSIVGSRKQLVERTRSGTYATGGRLSMYMNPADLDAWLPRILGAAAAGDTFATAETVPSFQMLIDKVGGILRYDTCYVNRAIFRARGGPGEDEGDLVEMILEIMATSETAGESWPGSPPSISVAANRDPFLFGEGVLTVNSNTHAINDFVLVIDNHLQPRWANSLTPTEICPTNRTIILRTTNPYTTTNDTQLYDTASIDGLAGTLQFTNGTISTTFTFTGLQWGNQSPTVRGKREIPLYLDMYGRGKGGSADIEVTNDATV